jgi:hypothetical protein
LTPPLKPGEMVAGQLAALRGQFRPVCLWLLGLCVVMMLGGFLTRAWTVRAAISYVLIWCFFFGWCLRSHIGKVPLAMWIALNTGRPTSAVFLRGRRKAGRNNWFGHYWWFYMFMNAHTFWRGLGLASAFPSGSTAELVIVSSVSVFAFIILAAVEDSPSPMTDRLQGEMRLIAQQPLPDLKDPRFKKWIVSERMPMSAYVKSYPQRMERQWGERFGANVGRQLGRGWVRLRRRP